MPFGVDHYRAFDGFTVTVDPNILHVSGDDDRLLFNDGRLVAKGGY